MTPTPFHCCTKQVIKAYNLYRGSVTMPVCVQLLDNVAEELEQRGCRDLAFTVAATNMALFSKIRSIKTAEAKKSKKKKSFISFPKSELDALKERLDDGESIFTTRIKDERGEYSPGQLVDSPFGILQVQDSEQVGLKDHPFYEELTSKEKGRLSRHKLDIVKLKKYELRHPAY